MESLTDDELEEMAFRFTRRGEQEFWQRRFGALVSRERWEQFARETFIFEGAGDPTDAQLGAVLAGRGELLAELADNRLLPRLANIRGTEHLQWFDPITGRFVSNNRANEVLRTVDNRLRAARRGRGRF